MLRFARNDKEGKLMTVCLSHKACPPPDKGAVVQGFC